MRYVVLAYHSREAPHMRNGTVFRLNMAVCYSVIKGVLQRLRSLLLRFVTIWVRKTFCGCLEMSNERNKCLSSSQYSTPNEQNRLKIQNLIFVPFCYVKRRQAKFEDGYKDRTEIVILLGDVNVFSYTFGQFIARIEFLVNLSTIWSVYESECWYIHWLPSWILIKRRDWLVVGRVLSIRYTTHTFVVDCCHIV